MPPLTQKDVAAMLGMAFKTYQSIELGRSIKGAKEIIPILCIRWKITDESWFWDGIKSPYPSMSKALTARQIIADYNVKKPVSLPSFQVGHTGYVVGLMDSIALSGSVPDHFAVPVVNDDNAPRFRAGSSVAFERPERYPDGCWVACEHLTRRAPGPDGGSYPVIFIRWYSYGDNTYTLSGRNPRAEVFSIADVRLLGKAIEATKTHATGWSTTEFCADGLPYDEPR